MARWTLLAAAVAALAASAAAQYYHPSQLHLYVTGDPTEMVVSWVTQDTNSASVVNWGTDSSSLSSTAQGTSVYFGTDGHMFTQHEAKMTGLQAATQYFYQVGDGGSYMSYTRNFTAAPQRDNGAIYAVYADFGTDNDVSITELVAEAGEGSFDYVIHAGDFAYDLDTNTGINGDEFCGAIEPISETYPYMVSPGNHEQGGNFTHYLHRFHGAALGAGANSKSYTNLWYSFDVDNIHWIAIDTEVYAYSPSVAEQQRQLNWLESDLIAANQNREQVPWIVMFGHKAWWMDKTNYTGFEDLAHRYGVDLFFCGHVHNYERNYPQHNGDVDTGCVNGNSYVNPKYMTTLVVGSPGCKEKVSTLEGPKAALAAHSNTYGFGKLQVVNETHAHWSWLQTMAATETGGYKGVRAVQDELWLVIDKHGPRV